MYLFSTRGQSATAYLNRDRRLSHSAEQLLAESAHLRLDTCLLAAAPAIWNNTPLRQSQPPRETRIDGNC